MATILTPYFKINGERLEATEVPELMLSLEDAPDANDKETNLTIKLSNHGKEALRIETVELSLRADPFFDDDLSAYQFYKEGLTAVGVSGSRGMDDCDFELDPGYTQYTVSDPLHYSWKQKNHFCAEQMAVIRNKNNGDALLLGFTTAKTCFCRISMAGTPSTGITINLVLDLDQHLLSPNTHLQLENLLILKGKDVESLLANYADQLGKNMGVIIAPKNLSGWCSYYYYYGQETESDILENAQFLSAHRDTLPVDYIQIDDGWQKSRGDWLENHSQKFPHGMEWLAEQIKNLGFKPGIWIAPLLVSPNAPLFTDHPDWLIRDQQGDLLDMGGNYFLDPSHPEALNWLRLVFTTMKAWGYKYFKLDFMMVGTCYGAQYHDTNLTRVQAYRKALQAIRDTVGPDSFLLGGTCLIAPSIGLVDGSRIATDVTPFWAIAGNTPESPTIFNVCRNIINRSYMHKRIWINDPDCIIVREQHQRAKYNEVPSLTLEETYMLASAMILSGASIFLGDRMGQLPEHRLKILQTILRMNQGTPAYPIDRMDRSLPCIWFRQGDGTKENQTLLGLFNWGDQPITLPLPLPLPLPADILGLENLKQGDITNVWEDKTPIDLSGKTEWTLQPHTCTLMAFKTPSNLSPNNIHNTERDA